MEMSSVAADYLMAVLRELRGIDPIKESFRIGQLRHLSRYDRQRRRDAMIHEQNSVGLAARFSPLRPHSQRRPVVRCQAYSSIIVQPSCPISSILNQVRVAKSTDS